MECVNVLVDSDGRWLNWSAPYWLETTEDPYCVLHALARALPCPHFSYCIIVPRTGAAFSLEREVRDRVYQNVPATFISTLYPVKRDGIYDERPVKRRRV